MARKMMLRREELIRLVALCEQFDVGFVEVIYNEGGGIGYTLDAVIETEVNRVKGEFKVEVTGVDTW